MKFSVVTPSLNQGRFIRDCIDSVKAQQDVEIEHIVVDACSTDQTLEILRAYPHLQWTSEPDRGQTDAINKGFRRATGDWLMWLNADDYLLPRALSKVQEFAQQRPAVDVVYGDCDFVDAEGAVVGRKREGAFDFWMLLFYGTYIPSTATFYRRELIDAGQLLDATQKVAMDLEYYLRLAEEGHQFEHLGETLACFRWHESNVSQVHRQRAETEFRRLQRAYLQRHGLSWMGNELVLRLIHASYRGLRLIRRNRASLFKTEKPTPTAGWWRSAA